MHGTPDPLSLVASLGKRSLAVGIQNTEHVSHLHDLGCELGQGPVAPPIPADAVPDQLGSRTVSGVGLTRAHRAGVGRSGAAREADMLRDRQAVSHTDADWMRGNDAVRAGPGDGPRGRGQG